MRNFTTLLLFLLSSAFAFAQQTKEQQEFEMTKDPALGYVPTERLGLAEQQAQQMRGNAARVTALTWTERGANNAGGRTRAVLVNVADATGNTVLAGSASGGLWRTTNFKATSPTWTRVASIPYNLAITSIAQHPGNATILYAGTGENFGNINSGGGNGIYRSTDGGVTWTILSSTTASGSYAADFSTVQEILVYTNGDVYAAGISNVFCNRGGILKSTDNGATWTTVIGHYGGANGCNGSFNYRGMDLKMSASGDLYATVVDAASDFLPPATMDTTRGKVFRSTAGAGVGNAGSWVDITPPTPPTANYYWNRIELACAPSNNNKLYALLEGPAGGIGAIRVSNDRGATWTNINNTTVWCDQGAGSGTDFARSVAANLFIAVSPTNDQVVFAGGMDIMKSTNGGTTWTQMTQITTGCGTLPTLPAGHHNLVYLPGSSTEFATVNNGGIYYSADNGTTYTSKNTGYNTVQYYSGAFDPNAGSNYMLAGSQDNGNHKFTQPGIGAVTTAGAVTPAGGYCFIDIDNPAIQINSFNYCYYNISRNGGTSFNTQGWFGANGRYINPADYDDASNLLYAAYSGGRVLRVGNIVSGVVNAAVYTVTAASTARQASAFKVDPVTSNKVWVAFSSGVLPPVLVYATNANSAAVWTTVALPASIIAGSYISSIDVDRANPSRILLSISSYGVASVYESSDGGASWLSLDNNGVNLPDVPVRWAAYVENNASFDGVKRGILLGTELGVWTTDNSNGTSTVWTQDTGIPAVRIDMLRQRRTDQMLMAVTHGRGIYTTQLMRILPTTLLSFQAKAVNNTALLEWTTSREANTSSFDIEKSTDGINFYKTGNVTAAGNSTTSNHYSFQDNDVDPVNYYRLRMNDVDGQNKVSETRVVRFDGAQKVTVAGNPFTSYIDLVFAKKAGQVKLQLINAAGSIVEEKLLNDPSTRIRWALAAKVPPGFYLLRIMADNELFTEKMLKQ